MFGTSMSESSKRREYSRWWMSWKSARSFSTQASSIAARRDVDPQLVALAEVAAVGDPLDHHPLGRDAVLLELRYGLRLELLEAPAAARPLELRDR